MMTPLQRRAGFRVSIGVIAAAEGDGSGAGSEAAAS